MAKFQATKPIKYRGVIYSAGDVFDVDQNDERVVTRAFMAEPVPEKPVRKVASTTRAIKADDDGPAPKRAEPEVDAEAAGRDDEAPSKPVAPLTTADMSGDKATPYRTRRLKAED